VVTKLAKGMTEQFSFSIFHWRQGRSGSGPLGATPSPLEPTQVQSAATIFMVTTSHPLRCGVCHVPKNRETALIHNAVGSAVVVADGNNAFSSINRNKGKHEDED